MTDLYFDNQFRCKLFHMYNLEQNPDRLKVRVPAEGTNVNSGRDKYKLYPCFVSAFICTLNLLCNTDFYNELLCVLIKPLHTSMSFDLILLKDEIHLKIIRN
jgi:hypothetical protein